VSMNEVHIIYCIALHACMAIDPMRTQTVNRFSAFGLVLCCHYLARSFAVAAGAVLPCFWPLEELLLPALLPPYIYHQHVF